MNRSLFLTLPFLSLLLPVCNTSCTVSPAASKSAMALAEQRLSHEVGKKPKKGTLVVVDYSKPSSEKRLTVVDLKNGKPKLNSRVAHGVNSGRLYATDFSNTVGSRKSSLGLYQISEEYTGKHGTSFRLDGLDDNLNDNARRRAVVIHAADYATREAMRENRHEHFRLGRSAGCLALSDEDFAKLDRNLTRPAYVFAYAPVLAQMDRPLVPAPASRPPSRPAPMLASYTTPAPKEKPAAPKPRPLIPDKPAISRPLVPDPPEPGTSAYDRSFVPVSLSTSTGQFGQ